MSGRTTRRLRRLLALAGTAAGAGLAARSRRRESLAGRVVAITGGSRGLGLVLARELADRGARLALCARDEVELERARRELVERGAEVVVLPCDVSDELSAARFVLRAEAALGPIDVLVNNAGIIQVGPMEAMSLSDYRSAMAVNFWGAVHTTLAVLPGMRQRRRGRVVNICSLGGVAPVPHLLPYTSSKFALVGFSTGLHAEAARDGIRVITVIPGLMRTGSFLNALFKGPRDAEASWFTLAASLPGLAMPAERAARRIALACERGESFVTLGAPAKVLRLAHALLPSTTGALLAGVSAALPRTPGGEHWEQAAEPGWQHRRGAGASRFTRLGDQAAVENNEVPRGGWKH